jgi:L-lysine exporter family protein LysE/ArgO
MFQYVAQGFMLGLAYLAPIGMQNSYVINTAAQSSRGRAFQVALITAVFDIALALSCFYGVGLLLDTFKMLKMIVLGVGTLAVVAIGVSLIQSVPEAIETQNVEKPIMEIMVMVFAVTWLNPQAIIDGSLLLGGFKASLNPQGSPFFILGVSMASASWFLGLSMLVNAFRDKITVRALRIINVVCGVVIIFFGFKLGWTFISQFMLG